MRTRALATVAVLAVAVGSWMLVPGTARADSVPATPSAATPTTVTADPLPTVQIDGVAWSQVVVGNTVYVAGSFTSARPAGAPAGVGETPRSNILAYDITTGVLVPGFAPVLNAQARVITASPDGSRLYVGGDFTRVDGQVRNRVAALNLDGSLVTTFAPSVSGQVRAIAASSTTVYLGGSLTAVGSVSRTRLAAVRASDGGLLPWAPVPGYGPTTFNSDGNRTLSNDVLSMVLTNNNTQVVAAGRFESINGVRATGVAAIDATSGANRPFAINQMLTNQGVNSAVWSLSTDGSSVYGTAYDFSGPGNLEGAFAVNATGGTVRWINACYGDTYSSFPMGGVLYQAGHPHRCIDVGSYPEQSPTVWKRATALSLEPVGFVDGPDPRAWLAQRAPATLTWWPSVAAGTYTQQFQGGWSVAGNGRFLAYGGEFPTINGVAQQGLVRFGYRADAPNRVGPDLAGVAPTAVVIGAGTVRLSWLAASDQDNQNLTYRVYRDGDTTTPVGTLTRASEWWDRPMLGFTDRGVTAGSHTYRVSVSDPTGNTVSTPWISTDVATGGGAAARPYSAAVLAAGATSYWPLGEASGIAYDQAGGMDMTVNPGVTRGATGAIANDGDRAVSLNGTSSGFLATSVRTQAPNTFSTEFWFSTTSRDGGRFIGFGASNTGTSTAHDRLVYMDTAGRLTFGAWPREIRTVTSPRAYNDGRWHHVVATMSSAGMRLFVDGVSVGSRTDTTYGENNAGFWRLGGDTTWEAAPFVNGRMDEVAVYPTALSAEVVASHYSLGTRGVPTNTAPVAAFTAATSASTVTVDGSGSSDATGAIRSWSWNWGDGTAAGSGATATHAYSRAGTYTVTLTVTDDGGLTGTTTRQVTVATNRPPTASFTATTAGATVGVNGSASADPDGTVAGHSWNWGDGTPAGTGATTSHTYAAAGTYTVTLTVRDDVGATATTTRTVTVAAPTGSPALVADAFDRTVSGGLGTADLGGAWTAAAGASRQSVAGGRAVLTAGPGNNTGSYLGSLGQSDVDVRTTLSVSRVPANGTGAYAYVTGRRVGTNEYRARLRVLADGSVGVALTRVSGGETVLGAVTTLPGFSYTPDTPLEVRLRVTGTGTTTLALTVWPGGTAEPTTPTMVRTDTTAALQAAGGVGLASYLSASSTSPVTVRFDQLLVSVPGAPQPPANQQPAAAFTATPAGLSVAVDGSASADPDGSIASHSWNWGDGTAAGSGRTTSHTYAQAGTYTVRLTVTDDDGATATTDRTVTVTAPAGPPEPGVLAADTFTRSVTGGLGTADAGGAWTAVTGPSRQTVNGSVAEFALPAAGNNTGAYLGAVSSTAVDVRAAFSLSAAPTGNGTYVYVTGRRVGTGEEYRVRVRVAADGGVWLTLSRLTGNVESFPGGDVLVPGLTWTPGTTLAVQVRVTGTGTTTVTGSVWVAGQPEPTAPQLVRTDTTAALQAPGAVGLATYRPGNATAATVVRFDDLRVTAAQ